MRYIGIKLLKNRKHKSLSKPSKTGLKVDESLRMVSAIFNEKKNQGVLDAMPVEKSIA